MGITVPPCPIKLSVIESPPDDIAISRKKPKKTWVKMPAEAASLRNAGFTVTKNDKDILACIKEGKRYYVYEDLKKWYLRMDANHWSKPDADAKWTVVYKSEKEQVEALARKLIGAK